LAALVSAGVVGESEIEREESLLQDSHQEGEKMIMIVKTPEYQMGSPAAAEEGGEATEGGRGES